MSPSPLINSIASIDSTSNTLSSVEASFALVLRQIKVMWLSKDWKECKNYEKHGNYAGKGEEPKEAPS